jgi:hypothetical protein
VRNKNKKNTKYKRENNIKLKWWTKILSIGFDVLNAKKKSIEMANKQELARHWSFFLLFYLFRRNAAIHFNPMNGKYFPQIQWNNSNIIRSNDNRRCFGFKIKLKLSSIIWLQTEQLTIRQQHNYELYLSECLDNFIFSKSLDSSSFIFYAFIIWMNLSRFGELNFTFKVNKGTHSIKINPITIEIIIVF